MMVKKLTLLLLASVVWLIAGFNVLKIGIETYANYLSVINFLLSVLVFLIFGLWSFIS